MKRFYLILPILLIAVVISAIALWFYFICTVSTKVEEVGNNMSVNVGKTVVIGKDTLVVTDYDTFFETYTLSNNSKVTKHLVENLVK